MYIVAVLNLKGGVGKTTTAINMAVWLARHYKKRVLLCDNDPQGNLSRHFECYDYDLPSMENIIGLDDEPVQKVIQNTSQIGVDIIPANMNLESASAELMLNQTIEQNTRLKEALDNVKDEYDFCIIDCPPGIGINVLNALCAACEVIVPVKVDKYALDGMEELMDMAEEIRTFNPLLKQVRCLVTMYRKEPMIEAGCKGLEKSSYETFCTKIRYSEKVTAASFWENDIFSYSYRSSAAVDYRRFVREFVEGLEGVECHG